MARHPWILLLVACFFVPQLAGCGSDEASAYTEAEQQAIREADAKRDIGLPVWCKVRKKGWVDGEPAQCPACVQQALKELSDKKDAAKIASKAAEEARGPKCSCESCESGKTNPETHAKQEFYDGFRIPTTEDAKTDTQAEPKNKAESKNKDDASSVDE